MRLGVEVVIGAATPVLGADVIYTLSAADAAEVNADGRRHTPATAGEQYAAKVVRVLPGNLAQLQVFVDGTFTYWAGSRAKGTGPGTWT